MAGHLFEEILQRSQGMEFEVREPGLGVHARIDGYKLGEDCFGPDRSTSQRGPRSHHEHREGLG